VVVTRRNGHRNGHRKGHPDQDLAVVLARLEAAFGPVTVVQIRPNLSTKTAQHARPDQDAQGEQPVLALEAAGEEVRQT
jgi:hypothetical protein